MNDHAIGLRDSGADALRGAAVLQVLPALGTGGVERGTVEMAEAVARAGGIPLVASAGGRMAALVAAAGGTNLRLPLNTKNPWNIWRNAARLEEIITQRDVRIVHARSRAPAWSAWLAARRRNVAFVTTYHGAYDDALPGKHHYNAVMARGERVIAISRFIAGIVMHRHGVDPSRVRIIHRGVDPAAFDPEAVAPDRIERLLAEWRLPREAPVVMLPGRLTGWKGQPVLIDALARLGRHAAVGVLVGGGKRRVAAALQAQADRAGVLLRLVGDCDDMPAALALADVVVNASTKPEAFGRVIVEAQAMARPVIATDHGGAVETVDHADTGWRVPPGDPAALAASLSHVLGMAPERRAAMGARARAAVASRFTVAAMQAATLEVYRELLD